MAHHQTEGHADAPEADVHHLLGDGHGRAQQVQLRVGLDEPGHAYVGAPCEHQRQPPRHGGEEGPRKTPGEGLLQVQIHAAVDDARKHQRRQDSDSPDLGTGDRLYEEDEWYFQFQDFSTFQSRSSAGDYLLEEESFTAQRFCATSTCSENSFSQDDLGDLYDVDFPSFWAQIVEHEAHRKSKEGECEKALIESANVQTVAEIAGRRAVGSSETKKELTFEQVSRHFSVPIKQAARELNMGVTVLKKQCRKLGIGRWPHRKVKSLQNLIDNVQRLGKENAQDNGHLTRSLVGFMLGERPDMMLDQRTEDHSQVCFKENAQEDDKHLTKSVVELLQLTKETIQEKPDVILDQRTKHLRQVCFKESFKRKHLVGGHGTW